MEVRRSDVIHRPWRDAWMATSPTVRGWSSWPAIRARGARGRLGWGRGTEANRRVALQARTRASSRRSYAGHRRRGARRLTVAAERADAGRDAASRLRRRSRTGTSSTDERNVSTRIKHLQICATPETALGDGEDETFRVADKSKNARPALHAAGREAACRAANRRARPTSPRLPCRTTPRGRLHGGDPDVPSQRARYLARDAATAAQRRADRRRSQRKHRHRPSDARPSRRRCHPPVREDGRRASPRRSIRRRARLHDAGWDSRITTPRVTFDPRADDARRPPRRRRFRASARDPREGSRPDLGGPAKVLRDRPGRSRCTTVNVPTMPCRPSRRRRREPLAAAAEKSCERERRKI